MKKTKKIVALFLAAVMLVCTTVAATVAYLTANTEVVNNTFTVGSVVIDLDELPVDPYGVPSTSETVDNKTVWTPIPADQIDTFEEKVGYAGRVRVNEYKLIPGHNYAKDPTVHVAVGSEECWLFVKVTNEIANIEAATKIVDQMAAKGWTLVDGQTNVYAYNTKVDAREEAKHIVVFEEFTLLDNAAVNGYAGTSITIDAYAVQADGFDSAAAAWAAAPSSWN